MVRNIRLGVLLALASFASSAFSDTNATDFTLYQADGDRTFKLSDARGQYVALHFLLKTTCPYCLRHTHDVWRRASEMPDVVQVFLKPDTEEEIKKWGVRLDKTFEEAGVDNLPIIYRDPDARLAKQFDIPFGYQFHGQVVHYPALVLLGKDGREVFRYVGNKNSERYSFDQLKAKVAEIKAAQSQ